MIASELILSLEDSIALQLRDAYSTHRIVYDLFEDVRTEEQKIQSESSGILYVDKGNRQGNRLISILSNRPPKTPLRGVLRSQSIPDSFFTHNRYIFEVTINPTKREKNSGKIIPIRGDDEIRQWFVRKGEQNWGFHINDKTLRLENLGIQTFWKNQNDKVTHACARFIGELRVIDKVKFIQSIRQGIGRGRAFGFGLLLIVPIMK